MASKKNSKVSNQRGAEKKSHVKKNDGGIGITPLGDRVILKELEEKTHGRTDSGIYIPETAKEDRGAKRGVVVACGEGKYENGKVIPLSLKVGQTVIYQWGDTISIDGQEYVITRENDIIAVIR